MKSEVYPRPKRPLTTVIVIGLCSIFVLFGVNVGTASALPRVVITVPHCDDEAIFAGEILGQYARQRRLVTVVFTTDCSGPPGYDITHPNYGRNRYNFAKTQLSGLGITDVRKLPVDASYNGKTLTQKTDEITHWLKLADAIHYGDELWTISNTGHIDHKASYVATTRVAKLHDIHKMYVYWAYEDAGLIYSPREGTTVTSFATAENRLTKNALLAGYYNWFNYYYTERLESLLTARKNSDDVTGYVWLYYPR